MLLRLRWWIAFAVVMATHFALVFATIFAPADRHIPMLLAAIGAAFLAIAIGAIAIYVDYRSGDEPTALRDFIEYVVVMLAVITPAAYLEQNYGVSFWLIAGAMAAIVAPLWWLYSVRRKRRRFKDASN